MQCPKRRVIADFQLPIADLVFGLRPLFFELVRSTITIRKRSRTKNQEPIGNRQSEIGNVT
jgi:hypothetical protein